MEDGAFCDSTKNDTGLARRKWHTETLVAKSVTRYEPNWTYCEWQILDLAIRKRTPKVAKKEVLLQCIQEEWEKIAMSKVAELVKSMPRVKDFAQGVGR